jgi:hypothetical protein
MDVWPDDEVFRNRFVFQSGYIMTQQLVPMSMKWKQSRIFGANNISEILSDLGLS